MDLKINLKPSCCLNYYYFLNLNARLIHIFNNYFTHYFVTVSVDIYRVNGEEKSHFARKIEARHCT